MNLVRAWIRERLPLARFGPLAVLLVLLGGDLELGRAPATSLAFLLLAVFRLRDDLAERSRDALLHPERVLVRATSTRPLELAHAIGLALACLVLALVHSPERAALLLGLAAAFELAERVGLPARHRWVLLKYPAFVALLGELGWIGATLIYLGFAIFERADDPELRRRSDAAPRLFGLLFAFLALAGFVIGPGDIAWLALLVGLWSFAATRALAGRGLPIFLVLVFVWSFFESPAATGAPHARDARLLLLR
ncbi:hypothetical protein ACNOYE_24175 [Nannocystaceae bacterium ST9]